MQVPSGGCCVRPCGSNEIVACAQGCQQCIDFAYFFVFLVLWLQAIFGRVEAQACPQPVASFTHAITCSEDSAPEMSIVALEP